MKKQEIDQYLAYKTGAIYWLKQRTYSRKKRKENNIRSYFSAPHGYARLITRTYCNNLNYPTLMNWIERI